MYLCFSRWFFILSPHVSLLLNLFIDVCCLFYWFMSFWTQILLLHQESLARKRKEEKERSLSQDKNHVKDEDGDKIADLKLIQSLEQQLRAFLSIAFSVGFLHVHQVTWDSPAALIEKVVFVSFTTFFFYYVITCLEDLIFRQTNKKMKEKNEISMTGNFDETSKLRRKQRDVLNRNDTQWPRVVSEWIPSAHFFAHPFCCNLFHLPQLSLRAKLTVSSFMADCSPWSSTSCSQLDWHQEEIGSRKKMLCLYSSFASGGTFGYSSCRPHDWHSSGPHSKDLSLVHL